MGPHESGRFNVVTGCFALIRFDMVEICAANMR